MPPAPAAAPRIATLVHQDAQVAADIHAILLPAYAQEAALLQARHFAPLLRSVADVRGSSDFFVGAYVGDALAGVLSVGPDDDGDAPGQINVSMLVVHPAQQRRGLARLLLREAIRRAGSTPLSVSTGAANAPALALYASFGFVAYRHGTVGPQALPLVKLRRTAAISSGSIAEAVGPAPADLGALGITPQHLLQRGLVAHREASMLELADTAADGRPFLLTPQAAAAWRALKAAAAHDGVALVLESAFRSVQRQTDILRAKLDAGEHIEQALLLVAPPGYSEHHTGRAIDIGTPGSAALEESFADTAAFAWLQAHAPAFGFSLSYPRGNAAGYSYEPWHWCHGS